MHKLLLVGSFLLLSATVASAQGKLASQWNCAKPAVTHNLEAGDRSAHAYMISQSKCLPGASEIGGVKEKEGTATQADEVSGDSSTFHGRFIETLENGDTVHYSYKGKATLKNGQVQTGNDNFSIIGGTGKLAGAKGSGSCKGTGNADGSVVWKCAGNYKLAK
jgi:hypothetical protein